MYHDLQFLFIITATQLYIVITEFYVDPVHHLFIIYIYV